MMALLIIGSVLIMVGIMWLSVNERDDHIAVCFLIVYIGCIMFGFSSNEMGYKQGQTDSLKGKIKYEQHIEVDTTYIKIK